MAAAMDDVDDGLYDYLLDNGVLSDDVRAVAESIVASASSDDDWLRRSAAEHGEDEDARARLIADRLLDRNAADVDRELDAIVRRAGLADGVQLADCRWPRLPADAGPGRRPARDALRDLNALARLPFSYDTYAGPFFRRLASGLEHAVTVDALFAAAARVYAKLVDAAPDPETAVESFASLCEAARLRCQSGRDFGKSVAAVCLAARCWPHVCKRAAAVGSKRVKLAAAEFAAVLAARGPDKDRSPYAVLCCADPTARWFGRVAKYHAARSAVLECLAGDRRLLKTVVAGLVDWLAEPRVPRGRAESSGSVVVAYARCVHGVHLLARLLRYRSARAAFPVRVSRTARVHAAGLADRCLAFLTADRGGGRVPATLARGLCALVATAAEFHAPVLESVVTVAASAYGARILARVVDRTDASSAERVKALAVDRLFRDDRWNDVHSLVAVTAAMSARHEHVWPLVTGRMAFLEAAAECPPSDRGRALMANLRCTPLAAFTYDMPTTSSAQHFGSDWSDPSVLLSFGVACATESGRHWLRRTGAFGACDEFVGGCLNEAETSLDHSADHRESLDAIVNVAYSYCSSTAGNTRHLRSSAAVLKATSYWSELILTTGFATKNVSYFNSRLFRTQFRNYEG